MEAKVRKVLFLLVAVTMACGVLAGATVSLAPAHADVGAGYEALASAGD